MTLLRALSPGPMTPNNLGVHAERPAVRLWQRPVKMGLGFFSPPSRAWQRSRDPSNSPHFRAHGWKGSRDRDAPTPAGTRGTFCTAQDSPQAGLRLEGSQLDSLLAQAQRPGSTIVWVHVPMYFLVNNRASSCSRDSESARGHPLLGFMA